MMGTYLIVTDQCAIGPVVNHKFEGGIGASAVWLNRIIYPNGR
jgi:hypothetical protein